MKKGRSPKAGVRMKTHRLSNGVDIDVCPLTGGVWLELGELASLTSLSNDLPYFAAAVATSRETIWPSPSAPCMLREIKFHPDFDIVLDYCPVSGGLWLDAGELKKVRALLATLSPPYSALAAALETVSEAAPAMSRATKATATVGADGRRLAPRPRQKKT